MVNGFPNPFWTDSKVRPTVTLVPASCRRLLAKMSHAVEIHTGARLHFGLLANKPASGRRFGGAGLMVNSPSFHVSIEEAESDVVLGPVQFHDRARQFLENYRKRYPEQLRPAACRIEILDAIPAHVGLGSGTQLGMAIAKALSVWSGKHDVHEFELARRVGRGARSASGIHGFAHGGFLVDGAKHDGEQISPLVARAEFPTEWRFLLVTPRGQIGLSGHAEIDAFDRLPPMSGSLTDRLCRILLMEMLPAIHEAAFEACGDSLYKFGRAVGEYFSAVQEGIYCSQRMAQLVDHLRKQAIRGVGQTSWGPTVFVLCQNSDSATSMRSDLVKDVRWSDCQFRIAQAKNTGAVVEVMQSE